MNKNLHSTVIGIMSAGGHKVDAESKLLLEQLDAGTITNEDAIKRVYDAIENFLLRGSSHSKISKIFLMISLILISWVLFVF